MLLAGARVCATRWFTGWQRRRRVGLGVRAAGALKSATRRPNIPPAATATPPLCGAHGGSRLCSIIVNGVSELVRGAGLFLCVCMCGVGSASTVCGGPGARATSFAYALSHPRRWGHHIIMLAGQFPTTVQRCARGPQIVSAIAPVAVCGWGVRL